MRALVIGSGVGGPVAATALRQVGVDAAVYEAHEGPGVTVGAHLGLAPNGLAVLRELGMLDAVRGASGTFPAYATEFRDGRGRLLGRVDDGSAWVEPDLRSLSVRRGELQAALAEAAVSAGTSVAYGKRLVRYTDTGHGVVAEFADGSTAEGDVLIGADGLRSAVRQQLLPGAPGARYTGLLGLAGWTSGRSVAPTPPATARLVWGRRAFFGYQSAPDGDVYWFVQFVHPERTREELAAEPPAVWRRRVLDLFAGETPAIQTILAGADDRWFRPYAVATVPPLTAWRGGRVVLLGDAAHAMPPSSGQGASMAMEGAMTLARCLRDVPDPVAALAGYERMRRERVDPVVAEGTRRGDLKRVTNPVGVFLRNRVLLPLILRRMARAGGEPWVLDHREKLAAPVTTGTPHSSGGRG